MTRREPPVFTENEWRFVAWLVASLAWIPAKWARYVSTVADKLRAYLGNEAVRENARPLPEPPPKP